MADYGEATHFEAAQALGQLMFMPPNAAALLRRDAQARMLEQMGVDLDAGARARSEALLARQLVEAGVRPLRSAEERSREEAARRAAVLAEWELEPLPGASGSGGGGRQGRKKKGGKKNKKGKGKPSKAQPRPATAAPAGGGDGGLTPGAAAVAAMAATAAAAPDADAPSSEEEQEEQEEGKEHEGTEDEEPVDLLEQHDDDCGICLVSMQHTLDLPTAAMRCDHTFHRACLKQWSDYCTAKHYGFRCPLCNDSSSADMRF